MSPASLFSPQAKLGAKLATAIIAIAIATAIIAIATAIIATATAIVLYKHHGERQEEEKKA